jgi:hypothetical protein
LIGVYFLVSIEYDNKQRDVEIMFRRQALEENRLLFREVLSPESVARHVKYAGIPLKAVGWRRLVKTVHKLRDARREPSRAAFALAR